MKIKTQLTFDKVRHDQENDVHCVVNLKAPKLDWQNKRAPICIIGVIDVSTSMSGDKLHYAKQSMLKLVEHLKPGDWAGLCTFGSEVYPVFPPREMSQVQKESLKTEIGKLGVTGCTNFSGGMLQALKWAKELDLPHNVQIRAIMFTDGQANEGVATDLAGLSKLLDAHRGRSTLSAFGYGRDANQDLLSELAKVGGGNYAFVENPEDALTAFARELGGLLSTYATDIKVTVEPCNGHQVTAVLSDVDVKEDGKRVIISLPNIYSEESVDLVMALKLSEQSKALPRKMNVAEVSVTFQRMTETGDLQVETLTDKAKVQFVKPGEEQTAPTPEVDKVVGLAQVVQAQIKAEEQAKAGNFQAAVFMMDQVQEDMISRGMDCYVDVVQNIGERMSSAQVYASSSGYLNSSKKLGTRAASLSCSDSEAARDFSFLNVDNEAQRELVKDFTQGSSTSGNSIQVDNSVLPSSSSDVKVTSSSVSKSRSSRW